MIAFKQSPQFSRTNAKRSQVASCVFDHLSMNLDPLSFLGLLPANGSVQFFLPFLAKSYSREQAKVIRANMLSETYTAEAE